MSEKIGKAFVIAQEKPQECDLCGKIDELRPYGAHGECICFECGMKDEATTSRMIEQRMDAEGEP